MKPAVHKQGDKEVVKNNIRDCWTAVISLVLCEEGDKDETK